MGQEAISENQNRGFSGLDKRADPRFHCHITGQHHAKPDRGAGMGGGPGGVRLRRGPDLAAVQGIRRALPLDPLGGLQPALPRGARRRRGAHRHFMGPAPAGGGPQGQPQGQEVPVRRVGPDQGLRRGLQRGLAPARGRLPDKGRPCRRRADARPQLDDRQIRAVFLCLLLVRAPCGARGRPGHLRPVRRAHHRQGQSHAGRVRGGQDCP